MSLDKTRRNFSYTYSMNVCSIRKILPIGSSSLKSSDSLDLSSWKTYNSKQKKITKLINSLSQWWPKVPGESNGTGQSSLFNLLTKTSPGSKILLQHAISTLYSSNFSTLRTSARKLWQSMQTKFKTNKTLYGKFKKFSDS